MKHTWGYWVLMLIALATTVIISINTEYPLSSIIAVVGMVVVLTIMPYMWYMENKLRNELNSIREEYGMKVIPNNETFWEYLVRL